MDHYDSESIRAAVRKVNAGAFGESVRYADQVESTNDIARELALAGAAEGAVVVADEQTQGRGRRGRTWSAPPGTSILMSVLFRPKIAPAQVARLVMVCGLAAIEAGEDALREAGSQVQIDVKWPNDLQIGGRKLAGILPESAIEGEAVRWVIVGMGINVNVVFGDDDALAETATSLAAAGGHRLERADLLARILGRIEHWNGRLTEAELPKAWAARCVTLGQHLMIHEHTGVAEGLDENGGLWLRGDDGARRLITWGEVS